MATGISKDVLDLFAVYGSVSEDPARMLGVDARLGGDWSATSVREEAVEDWPVRSQLADKDDEARCCAGAESADGLYKGRAFEDASYLCSRSIAVGKLELPGKSGDASLFVPL